MSTRIEELKKMLKEEPNDSFLNYALALEHSKLNELPQAIALMESVLANDNNYLGAYYSLGKLYEERGQLPEAITTYKQGIVTAKKQNNAKAQRELNEALMMLETEGET